jgi:hypothetical protein
MWLFLQLDAHFDIFTALWPHCLVDAMSVLCGRLLPVEGAYLREESFKSITPGHSQRELPSSANEDITQ